MIQTVDEFKLWCRKQGMAVAHCRKIGAGVRAYLAMPFAKDKATIVHYAFGANCVRLYRMETIERREPFTRSKTLARKLRGDVEVLCSTIPLA